MASSEQELWDFVGDSLDSTELLAVGLLTVVS